LCQIFSICGQANLKNPNHGFDVILETIWNKLN
jgi:hypothetical protein